MMLKDISNSLFDSMFQGGMEINISKERDASFESYIVLKRTRGLSDIKDKVISMFAKGISLKNNIISINLFGNIMK